MEIASLIAFNLAIVAALASPGPAIIAMLRASLGAGRAAGWFCGLGLAVGATSWSLLAVLGLTTVFAIVPWAFAVLKIAGAAYLLWLAISLWRHAERPPDSARPQGLTGFRLGLLTNMANPKAVIFVAAIFTTVFPAMPTGAMAAMIVANHLLLEIAFYTALTMGLTVPAIRAAYLRCKAVFDRAAAAILGVMAIRIVT
ncbi:LysE family transporter [Alkalilacustris brevis]|uniref:LysE family transporter n=1 Tax=Alkalilacustris brevis TaxID=2026338 RepID=UPI000E0D43E8|nr:LysE family transporter [Alkalilacustris brevis]